MLCFPTKWEATWSPFPPTSGIPDRLIWIHCWRLELIWIRGEGPGNEIEMLLVHGPLKFNSSCPWKMVPGRWSFPIGKVAFQGRAVKLQGGRGVLDGSSGLALISLIDAWCPPIWMQSALGLEVHFLGIAYIPPTPYGWWWVYLKITAPDNPRLIRY